MLKRTGIVGIIFVFHSLLMQEVALVSAATPQLPPHVPNQMLVKYSEQAEWVLFGDNDIANQVNPSLWQTLLALFSQSKPNEEEIGIFKEFATLKEELGIVKQTPLSKSPHVNREYHAIQLGSFDPNGGDDLLENIYLVEFTNGDVAAAWEKFQALDFILLSQPNFKYFPTKVPNDHKYSLQKVPYAPMMVEEAWDITTGVAQARGKDIIIAVLDDGFDDTQEDLKPNLMLDLAYNAVEDNSDFQNPVLGYSHGTAVASLAGAVGNNARGIAGISWNVKILPIRVFGYDDQGEFYSTSQIIINGLRHAYINNATIINMSLGRGQYAPCDPEEGLIDYYMLDLLISKNVLVVAGAGNDGSTAQCFSPANHPGVLAVTASNHQDKPAYDFSNYAPLDWKTKKVLAAPGVDLPALTELTVGSGTSYATPIVSGAAALILSVKPTMKAAEIKQLLIDTGDEIVGSDFGDGYIGAEFTYGKRINIHCALATAIGRSCTITPSPTPTTPVKSPTPTRPDRDPNLSKTPTPTATNTPTVTPVPSATPTQGPPLPTLPQGQATLQVDWTYNGEGKCWSAWATNACSLKSHEGGASQAGRDLDNDGVVDVTCSQSAGDRRTTTITNVSTKTFPVRCERYTCNSCKSGNGTHAQCDGYIDPAAQVAGKDATFQLTPGCVATCTIDGIYKNSCL